MPLPAVQNDDQSDGDGLRDAVAAGKQLDVLETVNDKQAEYSGGQRFAQILHKGWCGFTCGEQ